jgi:hypothetical protein
MIVDLLLKEGQEKKGKSWMSPGLRDKSALVTLTHLLGVDANPLGVGGCHTQVKPSQAKPSQVNRRPIIVACHKLSAIRPSL